MGTWDIDSIDETRRSCARSPRRSRWYRHRLGPTGRGDVAVTGPIFGRADIGEPELEAAIHRRSGDLLLGTKSCKQGVCATRHRVTHREVLKGTGRCTCDRSSPLLWRGDRLFVWGCWAGGGRRGAGRCRWSGRRFRARPPRDGRRCGEVPFGFETPLWMFPGGAGACTPGQFWPSGPGRSSGGGLVVCCPGSTPGQHRDRASAAMPRRQESRSRAVRAVTGRRQRRKAARADARFEGRGQTGVYGHVTGGVGGAGSANICQTRAIGENSSISGPEPLVAGRRWARYRRPPRTRGRF